ncbi:hypothetical protein GCM10027194_35870 [Thalassiella azotivora]
MSKGFGDLGGASRSNNVRGSEDLRGMITVSGVEMIPDPGQPGSALRPLLGPTLTELDPWGSKDVVQRLGTTVPREGKSRHVVVPQSHL